MSQFLPRNAVIHELNMQQTRKKHGLKTGEYIKYPNAEAEDHFVVKATKLYATDGQLHAKGILLKERMDHYLAKVALFRAEQKAKSVAAKGEKNEN